jgi:hypothetical protein
MKTFIATDAKTGAELFRGNAKEWDHFFSENHAWLGVWVVWHDTKAEKLVRFHPISSAALVAFMNRPRKEGV